MGINEEALAISKKLEDGWAADGALDDLVHDAASSIASRVNNGGPMSQVLYLLENGYSEADILEEITDG